jgi:hypothetical protein
MVEIQQGEVFPVHVIKEMRGRRGMAPVILNHGGKWICVVNITPRPLCSRKRTPVKGKGKAKVDPRTGHEGPEGEQRYSFAFSFTSTLDEVGGLRHAPAALPPGKTRYTVYKRLGGPQGRSGQVRKISPLTGIPVPIE